MPCRATHPRTGTAVGLFFAGIVAFTGCTTASAPRPQLLVFVDTDAPVVGQIAVSRQLSAVAAIDTVRVDIVRDDRDVIDFRDFSVPDARDWPLSFGVVSEAGGKAVVRLRIRAFRAALSHRGTLAGSTTVEPPSSLTIDRLVELALPSSSVQTATVVLSAACLGAPPSFDAPLLTCIDDARRAGAPADGVSAVPSGASLAGTSSLVTEAACGSDSPEGATCIPGGLGVLGDDRLEGLIESSGMSPPRPVHLSPFHMDVTELTVGRYRALLANKKVQEVPEKKTPSDSLRKDCTWLDAPSGNSERLPLNCISHVGAARACAALGGRLPSEAEWEYAARGRGLARRFPWGDEGVRCCAASVGRTTINASAECAGSGVDPVMTHADAAACGGIADVSRDGVFDLGGNLSEATADQGIALSDRCWTGPGVATDPKCTAMGVPDGSFSRGGDWASGSFLAASAFRRTAIMPSNTVGFRCVYDDAR